MTSCIPMEAALTGVMQAGIDTMSPLRVPAENHAGWDDAGTVFPTADESRVAASIAICRCIVSPVGGTMCTTRSLVVKFHLRLLREFLDAHAA